MGPFREQATIPKEWRYILCIFVSGSNKQVARLLRVGSVGQERPIESVLGVSTWRRTTRLAGYSRVATEIPPFSILDRISRSSPCTVFPAGTRCRT